MPKPTPPAEQLPLPLYSYAIFFDWFGTLSTSRFWQAITDSPTHPLAPKLKPAVNDLFTNHTDLIAAWMRGQATDADVCATLNLDLPRNYGPGYLQRALLDNCRVAEVEPALVNLAATLRNHAYVAIASDNMDCFAQAPPAILHHQLHIDELLVSSEIGALKAEDPVGFFTPFLTRHQLTFADAVLIDDCPKTCAVFQDLGGTVFHYQEPQQLHAALTHWAPTPELHNALAPR